MKECTSHLCSCRVFLLQMTHPCVTLSSLHIIALWQYFFSDDGWNFCKSHQIEINKTVLERKKRKKDLLNCTTKLLIPAYNYMQLSKMQWSVAWITVSFFAYKSGSSCIPLCEGDVLWIALRVTSQGKEKLLLVNFFFSCRLANVCAVWKWWCTKRNRSRRLILFCFCRSARVAEFNKFGEGRFLHSEVFDACVHLQ